MPASSRLMALLGVGALAATALAGAVPAHASSVSKAGRSGAAITLGHHLSMSSDTADIVTDRAGTAYVGWISSTSTSLRTVSLCVLPAGARTCEHGVQTIDSLGDSSAEDLQILIVNGTPTLFWEHTTANTPSSPNGDAVAAAAVSSAGVLSPATDVSAATSNGSLLDVAIAPSGQIWTITYGSSLDTHFELREGLASAPITVNTPYIVGDARIAWDHGKAIIAIARGGSYIGSPADYSASSGATFPAFKAVPNTWTVGTNVGLVNAGGHVRLVTAVGNASYAPAVSTWTGSSFPTAKSNGDHSNLYPSSHDVVTDASGRMVDVENENTELDVSNYPNDKTAAVYRFSPGGTVDGPAPQIATTPRGDGWVLWAIEDSASGGAGDWLRVVPIRLSDTHQTVAKHGKHGHVSLTGPASCLPAVSISDHIKGTPASGWKVGKRTIKLAGRKIGSSIDGAALTAGKTYTLTGTVVFEKKSGSGHSAVTAKLKFKSCSN